MSYSYVVTSQKSTAISHSVICNFTSVNDTNLVIVRGNTIEISTYNNNNLIIEDNISLFGQIISLQSYKPSHEDRNISDNLFILTAHKTFTVLSYDNVNKKIMTKSIGNVKDRAAREVEIKQRSFVDPESRMIGMLLYEGQLKV